MERAYAEAVLLIIRSLHLSELTRAVRRIPRPCVTVAIDFNLS